MTTENQTNYLNRLIADEITNIDRIGITVYRSASTSYFRAKYPTKEDRWEAWDNRDALDADLLAAMKRYLNRLEIDAMSQANASQLIDILKNGTWTDTVIEILAS